MTNPEYLTSRRSLFKLAGAIGAAATLAGTLSACGGGDKPSTGGGEAKPGGGGEAAGTLTAAISSDLGPNGYDPMSTTSA